MVFYINEHLNLVRVSWFLSNIGFFSLCLFYTMIFLKRTQDPLEGISKLDALQIISKNQRQTESFYNNEYETQQWNELSYKEKLEFAKMFHD